jgi:murein DD-endopeptidase MepM/ murein hydrolase activator NlpD
LLNAPIGLERVLGRLRRRQEPASTNATALPDRSLPVAERVRDRLSVMVESGHLHPLRALSGRGRSLGWSSRPSVIDRLGPDRVVAISVASILIGASVVSVAAGTSGVAGGPGVAVSVRTETAIGRTTGAGVTPRIAVGGGANLDPVGDVVLGQPVPPPAQAFVGSPVHVGVVSDRSGGQSDTVGVEGPFLEDGTLLKPVAVNTTVADGRSLVRSYTVKAGDTLDGIAKELGVPQETVWWANGLSSKDDVKAGKVLRIPPSNALVVTVAATETLDLLASRYNVKPDDILSTNGLDDANLVVGQVLVVPGAANKPIPTPTPTPTPPPVATPPVDPAPRPADAGNPAKGGGAPIRGGSAKPPAAYSGAAFEWPVVGGANYISQFFHYGHGAIDIAAQFGSRVQAAAAGVVTFAGWKNNGGGYQVWIAHGSNLFTTYNHMSAITVGVGQQVARGQQVGKIGQTGDATGPHLHFEVWRGPVWDGGQRVNPLGYVHQ